MVERYVPGEGGICISKSTAPKGKHFAIIKFSVLDIVDQDAVDDANYYSGPAISTATPTKKKTIAIYHHFDNEADWKAEIVILEQAKAQYVPIIGEVARIKVKVDVEINTGGIREMF